MINPSELRPGNLILYDWYTNRPPTPIQRGIVEKVLEDSIEFKGGIVRTFNQCAPIRFTEEWAKIYGFGSDSYYGYPIMAINDDLRFAYVHGHMVIEIRDNIEGDELWRRDAVEFLHVHQFQNWYWMFFNTEIHPLAYRQSNPNT